MRYFIITILLIGSLKIYCTPIESSFEELKKARENQAETICKIAEERDFLEKETTKKKLRVAELEKKLDELENKRTVLEATEKLLKRRQNDEREIAYGLKSLHDKLNERGVRTQEISFESNALFRNFLDSIKLTEEEIERKRIYKDIGIKDSENSCEYIEVDLSKGLAKKTKYSFMEKVKVGGIWMYPILFFTFLSFGIGVYKLIQNFSIRRARQGIIVDIRAKNRIGDFGGAIDLAKNSPYPYNEMLVAFLEEKSSDNSLLEEIAYEHMLAVGEKLYKGLGVISISASVGPLLGLLGTVTGIIKTFSNLASYGNGNVEMMSEGISEALITTEFGLMLAIPAFILHAILSKRAKAILSDMEKLAAGFLSRK